MDILQGALRDIAHALIQDAETKEPDLGHSTHVHLSASTPIPQKCVFLFITPIGYRWNFLLIKRVVDLRNVEV